jgi:hypothetical protein
VPCRNTNNVKPSSERGRKKGADETKKPKRSERGGMENNINKTKIKNKYGRKEKEEGTKKRSGKKERNEKGKKNKEYTERDYRKIDGHRDAE